MDYSELPKELEGKRSFAGFVESNKLVIGILLLVCCIGLGVILLWRENYWKPGQEAKIEKLEAKIYQLEKGQLDSTELTSSKLASTEVGSTKLDSTELTSTQSGSTESGSVQGTATKKTESQVAAGKISLNSATIEQLDSLPGIGPTYAKRVVEYRNANGGFKTIDEIKNVKGIGEATFNKFKNQITL